MESPKFYIAVYIYLGPYVKKWGEKRAQTEKTYGGFWKAELAVITGQVREPQISYTCFVNHLWYFIS